MCPEKFVLDYKEKGQVLKFGYEIFFSSLEYDIVLDVLLGDQGKGGFETKCESFAKKMHILFLNICVYILCK